VSDHPCIAMHHPQLYRRADGRFEIRCEDCAARSDEPPPIGLGLAVTARKEAIEMLRNHAERPVWTSMPHDLPERPMESRPAMPARRSA